MGRIRTSAILALVLSQATAQQAPAPHITVPLPALIPRADGQTVYGTTLQVRWLANANVAGTSEGEAIADKMQVAAITRGGSE